MFLLLKMVVLGPETKEPMFDCPSHAGEVVYIKIVKQFCWETSKGV
jgi:hypothetical protein